MEVEMMECPVHDDTWFDPKNDRCPRCNGAQVAALPPDQQGPDEAQAYVHHTVEGPRGGSAPGAMGYGSRAETNVGGYGGNRGAKQGKKTIGPNDKVFFGKHKGITAKDVETSYWTWVSENIDWIVVDPALLNGNVPSPPRGQRSAPSPMAQAPSSPPGSCRSAGHNRSGPGGFRHPMDRDLPGTAAPPGFAAPPDEDGDTPPF